MHANEALTSRWIGAASFPEEGSDADKLRDAVRYALLAPSSHNSQPWLFAVRGDQLELMLDQTRALPVVDPEQRELTLSCGAALYNLRVALRFFGREAEVARFPDPRRPELAAVVRLGAPCPRTEEATALFGAIAQRTTQRRAFDRAELDEGLLRRLQVAAEECGAWLYPVEGLQREALTALIMEADRLQSDDPHFRQELASWMHPNRSRSHDGMPGSALGLGDLGSQVAPLVVRTFDLGDGTAARDQLLAMGSPLLAVLGTHTDDRLSWLRAGEALEHVLLVARTEGVNASFLNQPVEVPRLRERLVELVDLVARPQLVLRLGRGPVGPPTPRRGLDEVLIVP
jgi:nitroreductase